MPSDLDQLRNAAAEARKEIPHDTAIRTLLRDTERCREALVEVSDISPEVTVCQGLLTDLEAGLRAAFDAQRSLEDKLDALKVAREVPE